MGFAGDESAVRERALHQRVDLRLAQDAARGVQANAIVRGEEVEEGNTVGGQRERLRPAGELVGVARGERVQHQRSRSEFIEAAVWAFIGQVIRDEQNARDLSIINQRAEQLNQEAADVLTYQVAL